MTKKLCNVLLVLVLFLISGCAAPQAKIRYVWPLPPDEPKIEYLGVYKSAKDIQAASFSSMLLGDEVSPVSLQNPQTAAGDGRGRVYVSDLKLAAVVIFDFNTHAVSLLGGEGDSGTFGQPTGIAFDGDGFIYVADSAKTKIMVFTPDGKPYGNIAFSAQLKSIGFIAIDKQRKRIIVPDTKDHKVHIADFKGSIIASVSTFKSPQEDGFNRPTAVAVLPNGDIAVADSLNARVVILSPDGTFLSKFGERGDNPGQFNIIQGIAVDSNGYLYITDSRANRFSIMDSKGKTYLVIGSGGNSLQHIGVFQVPFGISIDQNDTIYIAEKYYARFQKFQFITTDYLAKNPIIPVNLAKPVVETNDTKKDQKNKQ